MNDELAILRKLRETPQIFERLETESATELQLQARLRRDFPAEVVRAALTLSALRRKAAKKFSRADSMWFDRRGLEQSTSEAVAHHKARRFNGSVYDFCTGIGSDAIALAVHCDVIGVDTNPAQCLRTRWNAAIYGVQSRLQVVCGDVEKFAFRGGLLHIDPDQRTAADGSRSLRVEDSVPSLESLRQMMRGFNGGAIKLSPASNFAGKFTDVEIELVSLSGEAKEATIWFGEPATPSLWRATVLPAGVTIAGDPLEAMADVAPVGRYVYDPDPAVVRAGLIDLLSAQTGLNRLDESEEYLTSDRFIDSPFVQAFEVLAELPNNDREIRRFFRGVNFGQLEVKCRHIPIQANVVRRRLSLDGDQAGVLIFARLSGKARALVCCRPNMRPDPGS